LPASIAASLTVAYVASVDGLYFDQDRVGVLAGRMASPASRDEIMMNARAASLLGLRVGEQVPIGFYTDAQAGSPGYGTARVRPVARIEARITGLVEFNDELVQDDADRPQGDLLFTPALTKTLLAAGTSSGISWYGLKLDGGAGSVPAVERESDARLGAGAAWFRVASADEAQVQSSIEPDWIALAAFAVIALAVALLVGAQAIARQVRAGDADRRVLRALGAGPAMVAADSLLGLLGAVTAGALLAVVAAVAFSPVAPIGPVRPVYPAPGLAFDWTVLGGGFLLLVGVFGVVAVILAARAAARRGRGPGWTGSPAVPARASAAGTRLAVASGLPAAAVAGFQFAFDSGAGRGRRAVPARSALSAAVLAVVIVMTTLTFGSSLSALVSRPALYGWNWSYALASNQGPEAVPGQQVDSGLRAAPGVAAWSTVSMATADLDGQAVPVLFGAPGATVAPPVLSGDPVSGKNQVVLGPATLAALHQHVGGTVSFTLTGPGLRLQDPLTIVGTATMPTVGLSDVLHTSMGTGALASAQLLGPAAASCAGPPGMTFVRLRPDVSAAAGLAAMQRVTAGVNRELAAVSPASPCHDDVLGVLPVQHPAQIANYAALSAAPSLLAAGLAGGAVAALFLTLFASVRRRRHDLAVLKTLGFTRRQLAATVAWQATVAAIVGSAVGIPLGIALGRWLWTAFARQIYAVPQPAVPVVAVVLLPLCALALVNLAAALPGRSAARTPAALALRAE
ncbi:MAG TPA: FtsX-like permease family protein, partial [Streptosporangiaceae bacterium]|nr:FtsX-like permease family protein [Streptosporangiaceae bacterium]